MESTDKTEPTTFGALLAAAMKAKRLDYRTLATLVGVSHAYLWQLATADKRLLNTPAQRAKRPSRELVLKLAQALDADPEPMLRAADHSVEPGETPEVKGAGIARYARIDSEVPALFQRGLEETRRGNSERGILLLKHVLDQEGVSFVRAHVGLGVAYLTGRHYDAAIAEFDKAIGFFPSERAPGLRQEGVELADVFYNRGLAFQDSGRHGQAVQDMQLATSLGGSNRDQYFAGLCFNEVCLGRFRRVIRAALTFMETSETAPFSTASLDVRLYHAYAQARRGQLEAALGLVEATRLLCPTYWYGHYVLAVICSRAAETLELRGQRRRTPPCGLQARLTATGLAACEQAFRLNPSSHASFLADRDDDFAYFSRLADFSRFFCTDSEV